MMYSLLVRYCERLGGSIDTPLSVVHFVVSSKIWLDDCRDAHSE
jgi:hypothetical protein